MSLYDVLVMAGFRTSIARAISTIIPHEERIRIEKHCNKRRRMTDDEYEVVTLSRHIRGYD